MAQNFAGVSGANDSRNDIIIRGNSPTGVLWRLEGVAIPNPNHFGAMGTTGGRPTGRTPESVSPLNKTTGIPLVWAMNCTANYSHYPFIFWIFTWRMVQDLKFLIRFMLPVL